MSRRPPLVIIESPFAGDRERNERYLSAALRHSLSLGEAPFASHGLYTRDGVLDDRIPEQRERGILAGFAWGAVADLTAVYQDLGVTPGMQRCIEAALAAGRPVFYRSLPEWRFLPRAAK